MLSKDLELTIKKALAIAYNLRHEYATYEHLLLALTDNVEVKKLLLQHGVQLGMFKKRISDYLKHDLVKLVNNDIKDTKPSSGFQRVLQKAVMHSKANNTNITNGLHVLAELFFEYNSVALVFLRDEGLSRRDILDHIKTVDKINNDKLYKGASNVNSSDFRVKIDTDSVKNKDIEEYDIEKFCINLNKKAINNSIDCLVGRKNEIQRTIEILCRRKKNNAILIGEPGVGKTAIAEGLAMRIVKGDVPALLKKSIIYLLDIGSLVSGTKFRGDFEEKIKQLLIFLKTHQEAILFIDEIHTIIGAGSTNMGGTDASNLLKPALGKGEIKCIGATTFKEYHNHFEKDMALVRRFQKVIIEEPDKESSMEVLKGIKSYYEKYHKVSYADSALEAAVNLSDRYINDRYLPDKAIDLIDESGARASMSNSTKKVIITSEEIETLISDILNIPDVGGTNDDINQLKRLSSSLKKHIFGQDKAIEDLCSYIKLAKAGLTKGNKPQGCYLFVGPTGVGKTELAKQLAICSNMKLIRFDMTEFTESHSISKLLGSAPGYVGFNQGGLLTEEVNKSPYSVVLFDEIDKANTEILNVLLQIMDEGCLVDNTGKTINFLNTTIIMTTNIFNDNQKQSIGFSADQNKQSSNNSKLEIINKHFSAEFISRLDKIILFNPINEIINKIFAKNIKELNEQLTDKNVNLNISLSVEKYFVEECSKSNGARELDRIINTEIKQVIADAILFGKLKNGGSVKVNLSKQDNKITFNFTPLVEVDAKIEETVK